MQKLEGHWIPKRIGILEHYKGMTLPEIVLFDTYLLLSNKQTWECWRTVRQLAEILPMKKDSIVRAKRGLLEKGWIVELNRTGVFIPKLYRYVDDEIGDQTQSQGQDGLSRRGEPLSCLREQTSEDESGLSHLGEQMIPTMKQLSHLEEQLISFGRTIINYIIENNILNILTGSDVPFPSVTTSRISGDDDRWLVLVHRCLNLLKSIPAKKNVHSKEESDDNRSDRNGRQAKQKTRSGRKGFDQPSSYPIDAG
jgi:hypothetical protein